MNKSTVECLIKVGAFASINPNRAQLARDAAGRDERRRRQAAGTRSPARRGCSATTTTTRPTRLDLRKYDHVGDFAREEILAMEKDLVGLYLSGHPLENLRERRWRSSCTANAADYRDLEHDQECTIGGIIADIRYRHHPPQRQDGVRSSSRTSTARSRSRSSPPPSRTARSSS